MPAIFLQFGESCIVGTIIDLSLNRFSSYQILALQLKVSLVGVPQVVMADRAQAYRQHRELTESSKLKELNLYTRLPSFSSVLCLSARKGSYKKYDLWVFGCCSLWNIGNSYMATKVQKTKCYE